MTLNSSVTELTTGATDALLAIESIAIASWLWSIKTTRHWRKALWCWVFVLLAFSALLGAIAHGLEITDSVRTILWKPLYLSLGILVALFVVGALCDWRGEGAGRRLLPWAAALGLGFFLLTQFSTGAFIIFVFYEALALIGALATYLYLAATRRLAGAGIVATAIVLNLAAAGVQASNASAVLFVPLDHNGLFHLVQMAGAATLGLGLSGGMHKETRPVESKPIADLSVKE